MRGAQAQVIDFDDGAFQIPMRGNEGRVVKPKQSLPTGFKSP